LIAEGDMFSAHAAMRKAMGVEVSEGAGHLKGDRPCEGEGELAPLRLSEGGELREVLTRGPLKEQAWGVVLIEDRHGRERRMGGVSELLRNLKQLSDQVGGELR
jgi:hypothetical protein